MSSKISLKSALKTSPFIHVLNPEPLIPSISKATELYESSDLDKKSLLFHTPRQIIPNGAYQFSVPTVRNKYQHLVSSPRALEDLNLSPDQPQDVYYQDIISGKTFHYDAEVFPYAQAYAGFQFGQFAGQLGDGRVHNLFTLTNETTGRSYDIQLKGSGKTAFSRFADGKAVLRSSVREFIVSEALNGIGIPTVRALSLTILPGTLAQRNAAETCAVVARFSPSWIRLGTFDYYRLKRDREGLRRLCDYMIADVVETLPSFEAGKYQVYDEDDTDLIEIKDSTRYEQLYRQIIISNARTVAHWQAYGFLNGVLNTDNTNALGLSMDFGPFNFLDKFDPEFSPNSEDEVGMYAYENQPSAVWWNLTKCGEAMIELLGAGPDLVDEETFIAEGLKSEEHRDALIKRANSIIRNGHKEYTDVFLATYNDLFGKRLGLSNYKAGDDNLFESLLRIMIKSEVDFNGFFLQLQHLVNNGFIDDPYKVFMSEKIYKRFTNPDDEIDREYNDELKTAIDKFLESYKDRLSRDLTTSTPLETSSKYNPLFLPRSWILDEVIQHTADHYDSGDVSYLEKLLKMSSNPYDPTKWGEELKDVEQKWEGDTGVGKFTMKQCSCSS